MCAARGTPQLHKRMERGHVLRRGWTWASRPMKPARALLCRLTRALPNKITGVGSEARSLCLQPHPGNVSTMHGPIRSPRGDLPREP